VASIARIPVQIVYTPGSGEGRATALARRLKRGLERRGQRVRVTAFKRLSDLIVWSAGCAGDFSRLISIGGDATQSAAAPAAMRHGVPFFPVPTGFGNLFASAFEVPMEARAALDAFEQGAVRGVDAGVAGDEVFLCHASYGLLADVQKAVEAGTRQPRERRWRHLAYYRMARQILLDTPLPSIRVEADGRLLCRDAVIATVANVETYRGFLSLTPEASATDGWFDVVVMESASRARVWARLLGLVLGFSDAQTGLLRCRARRVRIIEHGKAAEEVRMLPAVLPVVVPPAVAAGLPATRPAATRRHAAARASGPARWRPAPAQSTPPDALGVAG
jgi:diacylglycerol kinase family enzyme